MRLCERLRRLRFVTTCEDVSLLVNVPDRGRQIEAAIAKSGRQLHSASSLPLKVVAVHLEDLLSVWKFVSVISSLIYAGRSRRPLPN